MTNQKYPQALEISPDRLEPNPWNSNVVPPENEEKLDAAISRMGFFKPIVVREVEGSENYQILGGQHRWEASVRLKFAQVPVFNLGPIDDHKAKEISLADNARYGADDSMQLAAILEDIGTSDDIASFLPFSDGDIANIFASSHIALDDLDFDENDEPEPEIGDEPELPTKAPKTHTIMRFKVSLSDAERLTEIISETQKTHGYTTADQLTNAGDALVHLLINEEAGE